MRAIGKLKARESAVEKAWAETRHPPKHVDVMSNEEYWRIENTKGYVKQQLNGLLGTRVAQFTTTRDLVFQFFGGDLEWMWKGRLTGDDNEEHKAEKQKLNETDEAYRKNSEIDVLSGGIAASLVLRSQTRSDPFTRDDDELK